MTVDRKVTERRENEPVFPDLSLIVAADADGIEAAAHRLRAGGLIGLPTETVYGLAGSAHHADAISRIFSTKGRPADHPLIVHIAAAGQLSDWCRDIPQYAQNLADQLWPGPLTLVLPKQPHVSASLTGGQDTVGIRVPAHPVAQAILATAGPVAAPSANRFGRISPTTAHAVAAELATYLEPGDMILDGGDCAVGIESTIVDCTDERPRILRSGFYGDDVIAQSAGLPLATADGKPTPRVSGSLTAHYAPRTPLHLHSAESLKQRPASRLLGTWILAPADVDCDVADAAETMIRPASSEEYARILYTTLRAADDAGAREILAVPPQGNGIAVAIRDRLQRAAAGSGPDPATDVPT